MRPFQKTVNVSQPMINRHLVEISQSSTQARYRNKNASTSKNPDDFVLGIMRHQRGYKKFSSTILILEKYMTIVPQLSTHVSQP
jgi:hypothetical protein